MASTKKLCSSMLNIRIVVCFRHRHNALQCMILKTFLFAPIHIFLSIGIRHCWCWCCWCWALVLGTADAFTSCDQYSRAAAGGGGANQGWNINGPYWGGRPTVPTKIFYMFKSQNQPSVPESWTKKDLWKGIGWWSFNKDNWCPLFPWPRYPLVYRARERERESGYIPLI